MKCIFCKTESSQSISIEHIIPESLGNKEHILGKGIVCDTCNQYFAKKIEKPLLETLYFKHVRHRNSIQSKKRRIPKIGGVIGGKVEIGKDKNGNSFLDINNEKTIKGIISERIKHVIIPKVDDPIPNNIYMSRFLAKVAVEILALTFSQFKGWNKEIVNHEELDSLRNYARYGGKPKFWEYHQRRIYEESDRFFNPKYSDTPYEILHEVDIKYLFEGQLFLILVIMGIEYVINFTNPKINSYNDWLIANNHISPIELNDDRVLIKANEYN